MEEIWKLVGGLPGLLALGVAAGAVFWRTKFPQIGIDYLSRELETHRKEIAVADEDRKRMRDALREIREDYLDLERRYMEVLQEKEVIAHDLRQARRQMREHREGPEV